MLLSTLVATGCGFDRAEADWASRSNSAATSGRPIRFNLSGEPGGGVPSVVAAAGTVVEALIRSKQQFKMKQSILRYLYQLYLVIIYSITMIMVLAMIILTVGIATSRLK